LTAADEDLFGDLEAFVLDRPDAVEALVVALAHALLVVGVERFDPDGELAADRVEQHAEDVLAGLRCRRAQCVVAVGPVLVGGCEFGERLVLDDEQPGLFEVGLREPPAAYEVAVEAVGEHFAQHPVGVGACRSLEFLVAGVGVERQVQRLEHLLGDLVVGEAAAPASATARHSAARSRVTWTKSLKWPACSEASWRLSVNDSSFLASALSSVSARSSRMAASDMTVVAVERPSEPRVVNRPKSRPTRPA
jgi:hypothetical protein